MSARVEKAVGEHGIALWSSALALAGLLFVCGAANASVIRAEPVAAHAGVATDGRVDAAERAGSARRNGRRTASKTVTFAVRNTNGSALSCASDGAPYEVKGHLVGPSSLFASRSRRRRGVTLYLHGFGLGGWFWDFNAAPGFNYATSQAKRGHASVVVDRIGYDSSGHPEGNKTCIGAQADIAHQVIGKLRRGDYSVEGDAAPRFKKVALAGHSAGGAIAIVEAHSFRDIDALIIMSFSFQNLPKAAVDFGQQRLVCQAGGQPSDPGGPGGYAYLGQTPADFRAVMFRSARQSVIEAATALRNRDPCGDNASILAALLLQKPKVPTIKVPVLVVCGARDVLFNPLGCAAQREQFRRSRDTSLAIVRNAGHALTLERTASTFRAKVSRWLEKRGF
jgi:pimeloyl-ACP methyl ester carboxylesterase